MHLWSWLRDLRLWLIVLLIIHLLLDELVLMLLYLWDLVHLLDLRDLMNLGDLLNLRELLDLRDLLLRLI